MSSPENSTATLLQFFFVGIAKIHEYMVSVAMFFDVSMFTVYLTHWIIFGLLGVFIYKFVTHGPADPSGDEEGERFMFWFFVSLGLVGFFIALVDALLYLHTTQKKKKARALEKAIHQADKLSKSTPLPTASVVPVINEESLREIRKYM